MFVDWKPFEKPCSCGRTHQIAVKKVLIEPGAIQKLPLALQECGISGRACILCDENTYEAAGKQVQALLPNSAVAVLPPKNLHPDEKAIQAAAKKLEGCQFVVSVGSGTLNDLGKYLAHQRQIPAVSVATAASMDGYVSTVSAMTLRGFKVTVTTQSPILVIADTDIFSKAPYRLTASGVGDMLGKFTALADWRISHILTREYLCEEIFSIEASAVQKVAASIEAIRSGSPEACETLMYGLILSGIAMQMMGNSRPASGCEHHLSHFWELFSPSHRGFHGEMVGVGLCCAAKVYHNFAAYEKETLPELRDYPGFDHAFAREQFQEMYQEIVEQNTPDLLDGLTGEKIRAHWEEIRQVLEKIPSQQELLQMLEKAGAPRSMEEVGVDPAFLLQSLKNSPYLRGRVTWMKILTNMGNLEKLL